MRPANRDPVLPAGVPRLGDKVRFVPSAYHDHTIGFADILTREVEGTIVQIHKAHRWYRVEYRMGDKPGCIGYEGFKY